MREILKPTSQSSAEVQELDQWIFKIIQPYLKGEVLEIGSGSGDLASLLVDNGFKLRLSNPHGKSCRLLQERFQNHPSIKSIHRIKPLNSSFAENYERYLGKFDTIFLLNSIEENPDDQTVISNLKKLVNKNGHLILQVPVRIALYNTSEAGIEYWQHSNRQLVKKMLAWDFGLIGVWLFNVSAEAALATESIPSFQPSNEGVFQRAGLSAIVVGRKM